ncbi:hypothetical protein Taro_055151, partial [Colocasia esculenta]|nr:hypothetical protein [Colocasia esculenta]
MGGDVDVEWVVTWLQNGCFGFGFDFGFGFGFGFGFDFGFNLAYLGGLWLRYGISGFYLVQPTLMVCGYIWYS